MMRIWQKGLAGVALSCGMSLGAQAATASLDEWGALALISSAQCASEFCGEPTDVAGFIGSLAVSPPSGGVGATTASATRGAWPVSGSARAEATVSGGLAVPRLRAAAAGDSQAWVAGQALVVQGYTYTGTGPQTLSLDWTLDGNIENPDGDSTTGLVVFAGFFDVTGLRFPDVGDPQAAYALFGTLALSSPYDNFRLFTASGPVLAGDTISIDVDIGAQFYLVMGLMAGAGGAGAYAESLSTLAAEFQGSPELIPTIAAVPLPAAAWLLLGGLGPFAFVARRAR